MQYDMSFTLYIFFFPRFTYEVSPVFVLMEEILLKKMQKIVGWSEDEGDGIFCPGTDMFLRPLVLTTEQQEHYCDSIQIMSF